MWFEWLALTDLFVFAASLLGVRGVWAVLLHSDPAGITPVTIVVFVMSSAPIDETAPLDLLLERTHGPHSTAWWVNAIQLKPGLLGLLGKVIGFSILALQIGQIQNFDPVQAQDLLKSLTTGLGVALLTTMVGLVGNILLGVQLNRLDRFADELVAAAQRHGLSVGARIEG